MTVNEIASFLAMTQMYSAVIANDSEAISFRLIDCFVPRNDGEMTKMAG
jgi:hypothetical protein